MDIERSDTEPLTDQELDLLAAKLLLIKHWIKAVEAELIKRIPDSEHDFVHVSVSLGLGNRAWKDEEQALAALATLESDTDMIAPRKVLSPTQAEKALGKKAYKEFLAAHVIRPSTGWKLKLKK